MATKAKAAPPFDPVQAALKVRQGQQKLAALKPEEQMAVRRELQHTGKLRTKLLRAQNGTLPSERDTTLVPATRFREAYSS